MVDVVGVVVVVGDVVVVGVVDVVCEVVGDVVTVVLVVADVVPVVVVPVVVGVVTSQSWNSPSTNASTIEFSDTAIDLHASPSTLAVSPLPTHVITASSPSGPLNSLMAY